MLPDELRYRDRMNEIWGCIAGGNRVIPFCTPVVDGPSALVIGTNHSTFDRSDEDEAKKIAEGYADGSLRENTFAVHDHSFALGLRWTCDEAGLATHNYESWVGTNRCAVQTDSSGIGELKRRPGFAKCQEDMDVLLKTIVRETGPRNLILAGRYAVNLYYDASEGDIDELECKTIPTSAGQTHIIPIRHPSMRYNRQRIADRLKSLFK